MDKKIKKYFNKKFANIASYKIFNYDGILYKKYFKSNGTKAIMIVGLNTNIKELIIPEKIDDIDVVKISKKAFKNNKNLETVTCPSSILSIGEYAFSNCINLKKVELSCNIKVIKNNCFSGCKKLEEVYLPFELKKIEHHAFLNCINLKRIPHYLKTRVGKVKLLNRRQLEKHLPTKLSIIEEGTFAGCENITNLYIPYLVKKIEKNVFKNCYNLKNIYLHNDITEIEKGAFLGCNNLEKLVIPSNVVKLSKNSIPKQTKILLQPDASEKIKNNLKNLNIEYINMKKDNLNSKMNPEKYTKFYSENWLEKSLLKYEYRNPFDNENVTREIKDSFATKSRYKLVKDKYIYNNKKETASIIIAGDIMCRSIPAKTALKDGNYNFDESFSDIKKIIQNSDLAICNLETLTAPSLPYCTEKRYVDDSISLNAPYEFLQSIKNAGFDVVVNANNHIYDAGTKGIFETLDMLNKHNLMHTGVFASPNDKRYLLLEVNGINIAILSYCNPNSQKSKRTNFTNYAIDTLFNNLCEKQIKEDINNAKKEGAEFIIAYCHWGAEYTDKISFNQSMFAKTVANAGANYIVGSHPHCLQKYIEITTTDNRKVPCLYSAGNFISDMAVKLPETRDTLMLSLELAKENNKVIIKNSGYIPCLIRVDNKIRGGTKTFLIETLLEEEKEAEELTTALFRIGKAIKNNNLLKMILNHKIADDINHHTEVKKNETENVSKKKKKRSLKSRIKNFIKKRIYTLKKRLTLEKICKICEIEIPKNLKKYKHKRVSNIAMSTRVLTPNSVLFTNSKTFNTEQLELIRKNCICVICPKEIKDCNCIVVDKPILKGTKIFNYIKSLKKVTTIAITGSIGKTSTKDMIASVLKEKYKTKLLVSKGNSNVAFRVASHILKLNFNTKVFLQEVGIGKTNGNTAIMGRMLEADIIVYTNIRDSHIEGYGSRENIFKEKLALSTYGKKDGTVLINYDDPILRCHNYIQKVISYSLKNNKADYYAKDILVYEDKTTFTIVDKIENTTLSVVVPAVGDHNVLNAVVAYAVGRLTNTGTKAIVEGLEKHKTSGQRQNLIDFGKYKVLADCYNSSYDAIKNILQTVELQKTEGKKLAVIGDIFELGDLSKKIHKQVGQLLGQSKLDKVIYYGNFVEDSYKEHIKIKENAIYCKTREEAINKIKSTIKQDDLILFKASNGMNFSSMIDAIFGTEIGEIDLLYKKLNKLQQTKSFKFNEFPNTATIIEVLTEEQNIIIPDEINEKPVEKLDKRIFMNNKQIKNITLNNNLLRIGQSCFEESSVENITFNTNLKVIAANAFKSCKNLTSINLPENLLLIGKNAFADCENLQEIYISKEVQNIDETAFVNCKKLIIKSVKDSYAIKYAKENNIDYKIIEDSK